MNNKLKIGLIGLGRMGQNHLRILSILKMAEIVFIYDEDMKILADSAAKYGVKASKNLDEDLQKVEAVIIVTPTTTHYEYVKKVSQYVKNIFVEKPLTDNLNTCQEIVNLVKNKGLILQVGFIERFNSAVQELKKIINHDNKIINIDFTRTNKVSSRITDIDVIMDLMIHDIDLAIHFNGRVIDVYAYGVQQEGLIVFACAVLKHENGRFSRMTASRITEKKIRQISVTADNMYVDCDLLRKEVYINKQSVAQSSDYYSLASIEEAVQVSNQEALLSEMIVFINSVLNRDAVDLDAIPNAESALEAARIADRIQRLILEGCEKH